MVKIYQQNKNNQKKKTSQSPRKKKSVLIFPLPRSSTQIVFDHASQVYVRDYNYQPQTLERTTLAKKKAQKYMRGKMKETYVVNSFELHGLVCSNGVPTPGHNDYVHRKDGRHLSISDFIFLFFFYILFFSLSLFLYLALSLQK